MEHNYDHHEQIDLPPGFRFHPTDEELISHYLFPKVSNSNFVSLAIGEVDLNRVEPWELPWKAKLGEKEWFFFCVRDRKYPTGPRTNRATSAGYWKATGKDKEIYKEKSLVGMKKTLVFYRGRAPKGEKTNWVMHEYRLDGKFSAKNIANLAKGEWVISKVFHKNSGGNRIPSSGILRMNDGNLPPLMEVSSGDGGSGIENSHASSFSESTEGQKANNNEEMMGSEGVYPMVTDMEGQDLAWAQDPSLLKILMDANNMSQNPKMEMVDDQGYGMNLGGQVDLGYMWNY